MPAMDDGNSENFSLHMPSRAQEMALAILPVPSAILSIIGSSVIIYMSVSTRRKRRWTPYTRLLLCLSFYDIVASVTLGVATLLRDKDTSPRPLSFGSSGTCSMVGFFNQLSYGTIFYNGMLSIYFLMTVRFGHTNAYIAKAVEPWMHIISNGYAVVTSVVALAIGAYGEMAHANGCWVADYPRGCGNGHECTSRLIGWLYFGLPVIVMFICLLVNNSIIFIFVRRQTIPLRMQKEGLQSGAQSARDESSSSFVGDYVRKNEVTNAAPPEDDGSDRQNTAKLRDQARRLRLVNTQAFLYVAIFFVCNVWTGVVGIIESSGGTIEEELQLVVNHYGFFVLQAILAPLPGLFNMLVFIRPKYHLCRNLFPRETGLWTLRRTILGARVKPTFSHDHRLGAINGPNVTAPADPSNERDEKEVTVNMAAVTRLPRDMISSVTASEGDFDSERRATNTSGGRWATDKDKGFRSMLASVPIRFKSLQEPRSSVLEVISENQISIFEHSPRISITEELVEDTSSGAFFPANAETRWASSSSASSSSDHLALPIPQRQGSLEDLDVSSSFRHLNGSNDEEEDVPLSADQLIKVPRRQAMPIPQRRASLEDLDTSSSFRNLNGSSDEEGDVPLPADQPIKVPQRQAMPIPQSAIEEPDTSSSIRHLNESSDQNEDVPLPVDQPIKVPQRVGTPDSPLEARKVLEPELSSSLRHLPETDQGKEELPLSADTPIEVPMRRGSCN